MQKKGLKILTTMLMLGICASAHGIQSGICQNDNGNRLPIVGSQILTDNVTAQNNSTLKPSDITIDQCEPNKEWAEVNTLDLEFSDKIKVSEDAKCYIYDGEKIVAQSKSFTYWPYDYDKLKTDKLVFMFEGTNVLPLGKTYKMVVPQGTVCLESNNSVTSEEITVEFVMPHKATCRSTMKDYTRKDGITDMYPMTRELSFAFVFDMTMDYKYSGGNMTLCREGIPIMEFPVSGGGDQSFGTATSMFDRHLNFEKGVNYSFVLPEHCVVSLSRSDLFNAEARRNFTGAYERNFAPIEYESCDVANQVGMSQLDVVNVYYSTPVALAPQARLQLLDAEGDVLKEASATLAESLGTYTLTADFDGVRLDEGSGYVLCIPEATVVGTGEDITVNARNLIPLNGYELSVDNVNAESSHVRLADGQLHIDNLRHGDRISVYTADGTSLGQSVATGHSVTVQLPQGTVFCIANVNGMAYKVLGK